MIKRDNPAVDIVNRPARCFSCSLISALN